VRVPPAIEEKTPFFRNLPYLFRTGVSEKGKFVSPVMVHALFFLIVLRKSVGDFKKGPIRIWNPIKKLQRKQPTRVQPVQTPPINPKVVSMMVTYVSAPSDLRAIAARLGIDPIESRF